MVTYLYILHCMDFSVNSQWWGEGEMMRPSVQGVDPPVCCTPGCYCYICKRQLCGFPQCAASWMTYARDSSRWLLTPGPHFLSRGAQTFWHRARAYNCYCHFWLLTKMSLNLANHLFMSYRYFTQKWKICHNLFTLKLFYTCMSFFRLLNTKQDVLKNIATK